MIYFLGGAYFFEGKFKNEQVYAGLKDDKTTNKNDDKETSKSNDKNVNINDDKNINKDETQIISGMNINISAQSYAVSAKKVNEMIKGKTNGEKEVFLTFDDGPSKNTPKGLEILNRYDVHGTFFALGKNIESSEINKEYI